MQPSNLKETFALLESAKSESLKYLDNADRLPVYPANDALSLLALFDEDLPDNQNNPSDTLCKLAEIGSQTIVNTGGSRYFGFVNGGILPIGLASRWLADAWDQNAALEVMSPLSAKLEQVCEQWLIELLQLPDTSKMGLVGGTSVATLCGLAAARNHQYNKLNWNVNEKGLNGAPRLRFIMGDQTHGTVSKMIRLLGFGSQSMEIVPSDDQGRLNVDCLPPLDETCVLVLQAGNVCTGSFDDFTTLCAAANKADAWCHIDGAFGLWAAASPLLRHLTLGIELADSWSVDGHKTLNTPYDCGIILCKHPSAITEALHQQGSYIEFGKSRDNMIYTPDMSRRARGIDLWACMHHLGKNGIALLIERLHEGASYLAERLEECGFTIANIVNFNQVIVHTGNEALTKQVLKHIQANGVIWCGSAVWKGTFIIRLSVCSWQTNKTDLDVAIEALASALHFTEETDHTNQTHHP
jgi:glutamate/tyrosine decarboxylase-like PLP-dependent enzyme